MSKHTTLLESLSGIISDYRQGEVPQCTPELIEQWLRQFPEETRDRLLEALVHVFNKTYISRRRFKEFLSTLASTDKLSPGKKPANYWREANLLKIQHGGRSQNEILTMFDEVLQETHGFGIKDTGSENGDFIYLDDCIATGNRVRNDVCSWIEKKAPRKITLHVITPIFYTGSWWINAKIMDTAATNKKEISFHKWRLEKFEMENRLKYKDSSDVLWPTELPNVASVQEYRKVLEQKGRPVQLRKPGNAGRSGIFKDDAQKIFLEQILLIRGCEIRLSQDNLPEILRPLGYHNLDSLGFGSMFVTYRNCPNNCPLAFWVDTEYPALFPRTTNTEITLKEFDEAIEKLKKRGIIPQK